MSCLNCCVTDNVFVPNTCSLATYNTSCVVSYATISLGLGTVFNNTYLMSVSFLGDTIVSTYPGYGPFTIYSPNVSFFNNGNTVYGPNLGDNNIGVLSSCLTPNGNNDSTYIYTINMKANYFGSYYTIVLTITGATRSRQVGAAYALNNFSVSYTALAMFCANSKLAPGDTTFVLNNSKVFTSQKACGVGASCTFTGCAGTNLLAPYTPNISDKELYTIYSGLPDQVIVTFL